MADLHDPEHRARDIEKLRELGHHPYPERFETTYPNIGDIPRGEEHLDQRLAVAGRVTALRVLGKLAFVRLFDVTGDIQTMVTRDALGEEAFKEFKKLVKLGDFIGVTGTTMVTKTGEFSVRAESLTYLGVSLRPLPEKWHGLKDVESRYRQRYLDVIANETARETVLNRSRLISRMRHIMEDHGFIEIETPVLNVTKSGALAKPFIAHHNALDIDLYLRIAPETYLKRANAAGFNRVFEFAKCFRNEGISTQHLQEFTMLEYYGCYWNFRDNMAFTKTLLQSALEQTFGRLTFDIPLDEAGERVESVDFGGDWPVVTFQGLIKDNCGIDIWEHSDVVSLLAAMKAADIHIDEDDAKSKNYGRIVDALYKKVARPKLIQPVFLTGHPVETSPLARSNDADPRMVDRFHLVAATMEIVNAYSELVDPVEQRNRLIEQASLGEGGDDEAMDLDEDFLLCMEHGMPPISGTGIGIDRLLKMVMGVPNIKDTVLFPLLRKLQG